MPRFRGGGLALLAAVLVLFAVPLIATPFLAGDPIPRPELVICNGADARPVPLLLEQCSLPAQVRYVTLESVPEQWATPRARAVHTDTASASVLALSLVTLRRRRLRRPKLE